MTRPLLTASFWLDTLERTVRTFAQCTLGLLGLMATPKFEWSWLLAGITIGIPTVSAVLIAIIASGKGEPGTASFLNPAPPDTLDEPPVIRLRDAGQFAGGAGWWIVIVVAIVLATLFILERI